MSNACNDGNALAACSPETQQLVQQFGFGDIFEKLAEKFGPLIAELLLKLLMKKSSMASAAQPEGAFDLSNLLVLLVERLGPRLLELIRDQFAGREDLLSQLVVLAITQFGDQLLRWIIDVLQTKEGAEALSEALLAA